MSMTDPIADLLARIRNAILARKAKLELPHSKLKEQVALVLKDQGYLDSVQAGEADGKRTLALGLRYGQDARNAIEGLRRVSRPGQRRYVGHGELPRVRSGLGVAILSTSKGLMTDKQAREKGLGGEVLCEVW